MCDAIIARLTAFVEEFSPQPKRKGRTKDATKTKREGLQWTTATKDELEGMHWWKANAKGGAVLWVGQPQPDTSK